MWWDPADEALGVDDMPLRWRRAHLKRDVGRGVAPTSDAVGGGHVAERSLANSALAALVAEASHAPLSTFSLASDLPGWTAPSRPARWPATWGQPTMKFESRARTWKGASWFLEAMDVPVAHGFRSHVAQSTLRQAGVEVALGELGGDSMFAGDPIFQRSAQLAK